MKKIICTSISCLLTTFITCQLYAQSGKVLVLNGTSQYMTVSNHADLNISSSKTITCWIKTTSTQANSRVFAKRSNQTGTNTSIPGTTGTGYELFLKGGTAPGSFVGGNARSTTGANLATPYTTIGINDGLWHHLAFVFDNSSAVKKTYVYIDGGNKAQTITGTSTSNDFSNAVNLVIGAASDASNKFNGSMDNVRIWNVGLTQNLIQVDMTTQINGPVPHLLAAWDFENCNGANVPDISGNNHPGTLVGNPSIKNAFNMAASFDGIDDYMSVPDHADLNIDAGENFTITAKLKTGDYGKNILNKKGKKATAKSGYIFLNKDVPGGQFKATLRSTTGVNAGPPFGNTNITDNKWHHLAMVVNVSNHTCQIYVDGILEKTKTNNAIGNESFANTAQLLIGTNFNKTKFLNGQVDDIHFWSKALSEAEVQNDMSSTLSGNEPDLLAAWDFENVTDTLVPDISGHNHTGTLSNGANLVARNNDMILLGTNLTQTELPTGKGQTNQRILSLNIRTNGTAYPLNLNNLQLSLNGTTNINDVTAIKIYYTGAADRFNTNTLFATTQPGSGILTASGNQPLNMGNNYFWIAYDINSNAPEGNLVDATCESIKLSGQDILISPSVVAGSRTILLTNTLLFSPGDYGSSNYRIPAIITAADGSLVTVTDKRWNGPGDLSAKIDPVVRRSTDGGITWSAPVTIANFGNSSGAGDASLVLDKNTGDLICLLSADIGFFASTHANPSKVLLVRSSDNGITWQNPVDITSQIYANHPGWKGLFVASGRTHQLRDGTLIGAIAVRENVAGNEHIDDYMILSSDGGITWTTAPGRAELDGDEAKVVELNNGNIMMSIRNTGTRRFNVTTDRGATWGTAYNQPAILDPNCNGDFIRYTSTLDGYDKNRLLHSIPYNSSQRQNVSVLMSTDEGVTWPIQKTIFPGASAYSSLTILPDGTIGLYYENGEYGDIYDMYFVRFSLDWLSNGTDIYSPPNNLNKSILNKTNNQSKNGQGLSSGASTISDSLLSINAQQALLHDQGLSGFSIQVRPNPSASTFMLSILGNSKPAQVRIFDMQGKLIQQFKNVNSSISFGEGWKAGNYLVEVMLGNNKKTIMLEKL